MKTEPVGEAVQAGHFSYRYASCIFVMDWARAGKCAPRAVCSRPQSIGEPFRIKPKKSRNRFDCAALRLGKTSPRYSRVFGPRGRRKPLRVPAPHVAVMPSGIGQATQFTGVRAWNTPFFGNHRVAVQKGWELIGIGQIAQCVLATRPRIEVQFRFVSRSSSWTGVGWQRQPLLCTEKEQSLTSLRYAEECGVADLPW